MHGLLQPLGKTLRDRRLAGCLDARHQEDRHVGKPDIVHRRCASGFPASLPKAPSSSCLAVDPPAPAAFRPPPVPRPSPGRCRCPRRSPRLPCRSGRPRPCPLSRPRSRTDLKPIPGRRREQRVRNASNMQTFGPVLPRYRRVYNIRWCQKDRCVPLPTYQASHDTVPRSTLVGGVDRGTLKQCFVMY